MKTDKDKLANGDSDGIGGAGPSALDDLFRLAFEWSTNACLLCDLEARTIFKVNEAYTEQSGYGAAEVEGIPDKLGFTVDRDIYERLEAALVEHGRVRDVEVVQTAKDGSRRRIIVNARRAEIGGRDYVWLENRDVTDLRRTESLRNWHSEFERLVTAVSARFIKADSAGVLEAMEQALAEIAEFLRIERAYICAFRDGLGRAECMAEWPAAASDGVCDFFESLDLANMSWWLTRLQRNQTLMLSASSELTPGASSMIEYMDSLGAGSIIEVPLFRGDELIGLIGLGSRDPERRWESELPSLLRLLSEVLVNSLERHRIEASLGRSEENYRMLFENTPVSIWVEDFSEAMSFMRDHLAREGENFLEFLSNNPAFVKDFEKRVVLKEVNQASLNLFSAMDKEELGREIHRIFTRRTYEDFRRALLAVVTGKTKVEIETEVYSLDGSRRDITMRWAVPPGSEHSFAKVIVSMVDITERKRLEEQLLHSQKMEAIGRLAGGIAHDFNNQLVVILNMCEMLRRGVEPGSKARRQLDMIEQAGQHSAALTRQLLAFSRKQSIEPVVLNINDALLESENLLRKMAGENVSFEMSLDQELGYVSIDPVQFQQVVVNLVVNAKDAMPGGGNLTVETANVLLDDDYGRSHVDSVLGHAVAMTVSDTGVGMDRDTAARVFEPFFTTKETGKGTGLGLSTVYGIARQAGGHVQVYSEVGKGSAFRVYFPRIDTAYGDEKKTVAAPAGGDERVLVVEDEKNVRDTTANILAERGYRTKTAANGEEALAIIAKEGPFDLIITDVVMPELNGKELADRLRELGIGTPVLYVSGYTENVIVRHGVLEGGTNFLQKPYTSDTLLNKVRSVLDGRG